MRDLIADKPAWTGLPRQGRRTIIRCLHGRRPEHRARRVVSYVLTRAGVTAGLDEVEVAVSELVTNARRHAPAPYELRIVIRRAEVKVAVMDGGGDHGALARRMVRAATAGPFDGESGRGLQIVTGLFPGCWGVEPSATCIGLTPAKQVWIVVPRPAVPGSGPVRRDRPVPGPGWPETA